MSVLVIFNNISVLSRYLVGVHAISRLPLVKKRVWLDGLFTENSQIVQYKRDSWHG